MMISLADMSMAADIPAPEFNQPGDSAVPTKQFDKANLMQCASEALVGKFPFDFFGTFTPSNNASSACPRIQLFEGTTASISFEMCFVLNAISLLKYPILIGLGISAIIAL